MKKSIKILAVGITAMIISLPNVMAEESSILSILNLEVLTEVVIEDAIVLEEWMIVTPTSEKAIELEDWMIKPFEGESNETALVLEDWMFNFS